MEKLYALSQIRSVSFVPLSLAQAAASGDFGQPSARFAADALSAQIAWPGAGVESVQSLPFENHEVRTCQVVCSAQSAPLPLELRGDRRCLCKVLARQSCAEALSSRASTSTQSTEKVHFFSERLSWCSCGAGDDAVFQEGTAAHVCCSALEVLHVNAKG